MHEQQANVEMLRDERDRLRVQLEQVESSVLQHAIAKTSHGYPMVASVPPTQLSTTSAASDDVAEPPASASHSSRLPVPQGVRRLRVQQTPNLATASTVRF